MADIVAADDDPDICQMVEVVLRRSGGAAVLRESPSTADIPVVLATGSVSPTEAAAVLGDGDQLLPKPFRPAELPDAVDTALRFTDASAAWPGSGRAEPGEVDSADATRQHLGRSTDEADRSLQDARHDGARIVVLDLTDVRSSTPPRWA